MKEFLLGLLIETSIGKTFLLGLDIWYKTYRKEISGLDNEMKLTEKPDIYNIINWIDIFC